MADSGLLERIRALPLAPVVREGSALREYGRDEGFARRGRRSAPDAVVVPRTVEEVQAVVRLAAEVGVPIVPWGSGSSLEGQGLALHGGITLDMREMNRMRRLLIDDFQVEVDAGITHPELNRLLRPHGVFFPPNPGAPATIGGMIGNNSSGGRAVKYGVTRDHVVALEVVLADGALVRLGTRASKTSSGYDLVDLFIGSEGTLGIVTGAVLRVSPTPAVERGLVARFDTVDTAAEVVRAVLGIGVRPASLELLENSVAPVLAKSSPLDPRPVATLLVACDGAEEAAVDSEIGAVNEIVAEFGGEVEATTRDQFHAIMSAREQLGPAVVRATGMPTLKLVDIAVPLSAFPDAVALARRVLDAAGLTGHVFGHAGDGNLHVLIATDSRDDAHWARASEAADEIVLGALALEGTITGEHGIGAAKRHLLRAEHGGAVDVMMAIKRSLDPKGIMNPGKILPDDASDGVGS